MTKKDRELLFSTTKKDFRIETYRGSGPGGQNKNKRDTAVRITHDESGAVGSSETYRTQGENKRAAFYRLVKTPEWRKWQAQRVFELQRGKTLDEEVTEWMVPDNLVVEVYQNGEWTSAS